MLIGVHRFVCTHSLQLRLIQAHLLFLCKPQEGIATLTLRYVTILSGHNPGNNIPRRCFFLFVLGYIFFFPIYEQIHSSCGGGKYNLLLDLNTWPSKWQTVLCLINHLFCCRIQTLPTSSDDQWDTTNQSLDFWCRCYTLLSMSLCWQPQMTLDKDLNTDEVKGFLNTRV